MNQNEKAYHYASLLVKRIKGEASEQEELELLAWLDQNAENKRLLAMLEDEKLLQKDFDFINSIEQDEAWNKIMDKVQNKSFLTRITQLIQKFKYAAIVVVLFSAAMIYDRVTSHKRLPGQDLAKNHKFQQVISPGKDGAISTTKNGLTTITTPAGYKYQIKLSDGSRIWLNSSSSLSFPVKFSARQRLVQLTGEAYFEVTKNKHSPFKVSANHAFVQVLGTHFNVKAYKDDPILETTLLEGSVKIVKGEHSKMMVPGQQASIGEKSSLIVIKQANLSESIAWKNDLFLFDSEDIQSVMRQIARWYNISVVYQDPPPSLHFSGRISRTNNLSETLNMLELTGGVHFKIEERKVTVTR